MSRSYKPIGREPFEVAVERVCDLADAEDWDRAERAQAGRELLSEHGGGRCIGHGEYENGWRVHECLMGKYPPTKIEDMVNFMDQKGPAFGTSPDDVMDEIVRKAYLK